jgi:hypothetical protein
LAGDGLSADEISRRVIGNGDLTAAEPEFLRLKESSVRALLGPGVAEGIRDSHTLAATVVLKMPHRLRGVRVQEFLGWIQASDDASVSECMRAATVHSSATLGELNSFERAALIGVLRLRAELSDS